MIQRFAILLILLALTGSVQAQFCTTPTNITQVAVDASSATFSWGAVNGTIGYEITYRVANTGTWITEKTSSTIYTLRNLAPGSVYEVKLRTDCGKGGISEYSSASLFATQSGGQRCEMPTNVATSGTTGSACTISWQGVRNAQNYEVSYRPAGAAQWNSLMTTSTSVTLTSLSPSTGYEIRIRTQCADGSFSEYSTVVQVTTTQESNAKCTAPSGLKASNATNSGVTLQWTGSNDAWFYEIQYRKQGDSNWWPAYTTGTIRDLFLLTPGTTYEVRVRTQCGWGLFSDYSETIQFTTSGQSNVCNAPANLRVKEVNGNLISLEWDASSGGVWLYEIQYRRMNTDFWLPFYAFSNNGIIFVFSRDDMYEVRVRALCNWGNYSDFSNTVTTSVTGNSSNCPIPSNLVAGGVTSNSATLQWQAVSGANDYSVRYRSAGGLAWMYYFTSNTSVTLNNVLQPLRTYEWQVHANCGSTAGSWSPIASFSTANGRAGFMDTEAATPSVSVYPNPNQGSFELSYTAHEQENATVQVLDLQGKIVSQRNWRLAAGDNKLFMELENVEPGMYIIKITSGGTAITEKFIVN